MWIGRPLVQCGRGRPLHIVLRYNHRTRRTRMQRIGTLIAQSATLTPMYADRLLAGIAPENFARFARPGGTVVKSNHPAFVFGHLSLYPARVMQHCGKPVGVAQPPAGYEALFKNGVECQDDPSGTIYPPMKDMTKFFFDAYNAAIGAVAGADDEALTAPNPAEGRMRELFPTVGAVLIFYLTGHTQSHFGQISAWRRMMGLPPA